MWMRGHNQVQAFDPMATQIGRDYWPGILITAVDEHVLVVELQQDGVTLAHVQEVSYEVLSCGYGSCRDGNYQERIEGLFVGAASN